MASGSQVTTRSRALTLEFRADASGNFQGGQTVSANSGDEIRLAFTDVPGPGHTLSDLSITINGSSVGSARIIEVVRMSSSGPIIGTSTLEAVLPVKQTGRSTVQVKPLDASGQPKGSLAFAIDVV